MSQSTPFPLLRSDHKILGSEYCSGYSDIFGKWNTGFYCPQSESRTAISCCGTPTYKYCCTTKDFNTGEDEDGTEASGIFLSHLIQSPPIIIGIICGILLVVLILTFISCHFCSCCFFYKKRRAHLPGGLYRLPITSSSTTSALVNTYSTSSNFSNNAPSLICPLDTDWIGRETNQSNSSDGSSGGSATAQIHNSNGSNSVNRSSLPGNIRNGGPSSVSNGIIPQDMLQQYISARNLANQINRTNYTNGILPRYFYTHHPPPPAYSTINHHSPYPPPPPSIISSSNTSSAISPPPRTSSLTNTETGGNGGPPPHYIGYTISTESRPYVISPSTFNPTQFPAATDRPRSVISLRNNVAYITSTLPLSNSFVTARSRALPRSVHFREEGITNDSNFKTNLSLTNSRNLIGPRRNLGAENSLPDKRESIPSSPRMKVTQVISDTQIETGVDEGDPVKLKSPKSSSPPLPPVGLNIEATGTLGNESKTTSRILEDKDLFTHPMTVSTAFGMSPIPITLPPSLSNETTLLTSSNTIDMTESSGHDSQMSLSSPSSPQESNYYKNMNSTRGSTPRIGMSPSLSSLHELTSPKSSIILGRSPSFSGCETKIHPRPVITHPLPLNVSNGPPTVIETFRVLL